MKVSDVLISDEQFAAACADIEGFGFVLSDLQQALEAQKVPTSVSYEAAKRHLQALRRDGLVRFDRASGTWEFPEITDGAKRSVQETSQSGGFGSWVTWLVSWVTCLASIGALIAINASFAYELAETDTLKMALVVALMASDLLRPLLVERGFGMLRKSRAVLGILGIFLAFLLSPLSVLSSTSAIFASLQLGVEATVQANQEGAAKDRLADRYDYLQNQAAKLWDEHSDECARGGCGSRANALADEARGYEAEAREMLEALSVGQAEPAESSFAQRTLVAFEALGLYGPNRAFFLPLAIALTLELAALLGPAILPGRAARD